MNLLIINPIIRPNEKPMCIPHGLAIIANIVRKKFPDVNITFLDINGHRYTEQKVKQIIRTTDFDVVFIGGLIPVYRQVIELSEYIKEVNPNAIIVVGGSVAMSIPEELLRNSEVDIICMGEGEVTVVEIVRYLKNNKEKIKGTPNIKGIAYLYGGVFVKTEPEPFIQDLDTESIIPAYDLIPMDIYTNVNVLGMGKEIDFVTARGCPFHCSFCYQPWGHKQRLHSIAFMKRAIRHLVYHYDIDFIAFMDDEFMANTKRLNNFLDIRNKYFPDLYWSGTGRTNITVKHEDLIKKCRNSGCVDISYGFESGSPRMLKSMHKAQTIEMMEKTIEITRKYGLPTATSFIIGMPGETKVSCQETLDFALRNNISLASLMFATPYPGTEIFNYAMKTGRIKDVHKFALSLRDARDFVVNLTDEFTDQELIDKRQEMIDTSNENYYNFISRDQIRQKIKDLFGPLMDKTKFDDKDLENRMKYGGIGMF